MTQDFVLFPGEHGSLGNVVSMPIGGISKQFHGQWRREDRTFKVGIPREIRDLWVTLVQRREKNTKERETLSHLGGGGIRRERPGSAFWIPKEADREKVV